MKTLNEIANIAGPELWADIEPHFAAQLEKCNAEKSAAVDAAKLAIQSNLDALVQAAESAHASGDLDAIAAVIAQAKSYTTTARRAKLEANLASAQAAATEAAAKLAALHG